MVYLATNALAVHLQSKIFLFFLIPSSVACTPYVHRKTPAFCRVLAFDLVVIVVIAVREVYLVFIFNGILKLNELY